MTEYLTMREFTMGADALQFRDDGAKTFVEGLVVPFNSPTDIVEVRSDGPIRYREQFAPGAFQRAVRAPHRVTFVYGHSDSLSERLGSGESFVESVEGLIGTFRLDRSRCEQARDVIETSHSALSVGFVSLFPAAMTEREGELVIRSSVHLGHVAVVPMGAYTEARVLAMRGDIDDEPTPAEIAEQARIAEEAELLEWVNEAAESQRVLEGRS